MCWHGARCAAATTGTDVARLDTVKEVKSRWNVDVVAGNIATAEAVRALVANGADGTLGSFEDGRLDKLVDILSPIFAKQNTPVKDGLALDEIATNEFLDPSVSL